MSVKTKYIDDIGEVRFVKRKGQKSISISIRPGQVRVGLPKSTPFYVAEKFVLSKKDWILKHATTPDSLRSGASIGKTHTLQIDPERQKTHIKDGVITTPDNPTLIDKAAKKALLLESKQQIEPMVWTLADVVGLTPSELVFKPMKSRWGSCSSTKLLTINTMLIQLPWDLIEYVIIHELCHIEEMNHSQDFWDLVGKHCPDYKHRRRAIKKYSPVVFDTTPKSWS